jgi:hypothetical protein
VVRRHCRTRGWGLMAAEHRGTVKFGTLPIPGAGDGAAGDKKPTVLTDAQGGTCSRIWPMGWKMVEMRSRRPSATCRVPGPPSGT